MAVSDENADSTDLEAGEDLAALSDLSKSNNDLGQDLASRKGISRDTESTSIAD